MSERYTKRDAERAYQRLLEASGAKDGDAMGIHDPQREGAWTLDNQPTYGGFTIRAYVADSPPQPGDDRPQAYTAVTQVFDDRRRSAREFCDYVTAILTGMKHAA